MTNLEAGMTYATYVTLYTGIYNYCTSSRMNQGPKESLSTATHRGANLVGKELYDNLRNLLKGFMVKLKEQSQDKTDIELLRFYTESWEKFTIAARLLQNIFAYLNRHWVKREVDEGHKHIYEVYTVRFD
jgi:cullin 1